MMKTYDIYGAEAGDIEKIRNALEDVLLIRLDPRESSYMGEYFLGNLDDEEFQLRRNSDPIDGESIEKALPKNGILLYVNRTKRPKELEKLLLTRVPEFQLLKRTEL